MPTNAEPFGRYLLNRELPDNYKLKGAITKGELTKSMSDLAHADPQQYVKTITALKGVGDTLATSEGLSVGLDDIAPEYGVRDRAMAPLRQKYDMATTDTERKRIAIKAQDVMKEVAMKHKGTLTQQVRSGARGNVNQYTNLTGALGYVRDPDTNDATPLLMDKSYSEGLSPGQYWNASRQSMMDTIKVYTSVAEPGDLGKKLVNNMNSLVVTEIDCGTDNGIFVDPTTPEAQGRYLARAEGHFKYNTLITPEVQTALARRKKNILVRSPMTCEADDGVCQKCQGLDEKGLSHQMGINVGVRSAQALAEPLVQFALDSKHGGRTIQSDAAQVGGIKGFRQIIDVPQQFINKATLATVPGKITKIEDAAQGGYRVFVDDTSHYVEPNRKVVVKIGQKVFAGDALSDGVPKPDEIVKYKGLGEGRQYFVSALKDIYKSQGKKMDQRHFELLAKGQLDHVRVLSDPSHTFIPGDIVSYNAVRKHLKSTVHSLPLESALGETLGKSYFQFLAGTRITEEVFNKLKQHEVKDVMVASRAPEIEFTMKPATTAPTLHPDWMGRMAYRGLKTTIQQAAQYGQTSDIHGTHPVPGYVTGVEFGKGESGRY
jgi:DNA-directed RNA polymerase subunit beta'